MRCISGQRIFSSCSAVSSIPFLYSKNDDGSVGARSGLIAFDKDFKKKSCIPNFADTYHGNSANSWQLNAHPDVSNVQYSVKFAVSVARVILILESEPAKIRCAILTENAGQSCKVPCLTNERGA